MTTEYLIEKLNLSRHPEGGYYRETFRSENQVTLENGTARNTATLIYYLLKDADKSHFHKISFDEIWLFHQGEPIEIFIITMDGHLETKTLGNRIELGESPQVIIPAHQWFAAKLKNEKGFALASCLVSPGFDFKDFELGKKEDLIKAFPGIKADIEKLCL